MAPLPPWLRLCISYAAFISFGALRDENLSCKVCRGQERLGNTAAWSFWEYLKCACVGRSAVTDCQNSSPLSLHVLGSASVFLSILTQLLRNSHATAFEAAFESFRRDHEADQRMVISSFGQNLKKNSTGVDFYQQMQWMTSCLSLQVVLQPSRHELFSADAFRFAGHFHQTFAVSALVTGKMFRRFCFSGRRNWSFCLVEKNNAKLVQRFGNDGCVQTFIAVNIVLVGTAIVWLICKLQDYHGLLCYGHTAAYDRAHCGPPNDATPNTNPNRLRPRKAAVCLQFSRPVFFRWIASSTRYSFHCTSNIQCAKLCFFRQSFCRVVTK